MCRFALMLAVILSSLNSATAAEPRQILSWPAVSARYIAFGYAGDLWVVERTGGAARRLTAGIAPLHHTHMREDMK